jgi:cobalamin-dependent methionine synthase I
VQYNVATYESEREEFQAMLQEKKAQLYREKERFLTERVEFKEIVSKSCHFVLGFAQEEHESFDSQVVKLVETIKKIQSRIA